MAGRALRVLGLAYREDALGADSRTVERAMVWVGLVGMLDPPRPEVLAAIAECRAAGISPVIITGDHKLTALAVAREIGALRPGDEAISGEELDLLTPEALGACVERYRVYARVTAEHKLRIIRTWKRRGHLVAMTGDGINDAPALREADIGIAMGRGGTEVTREAAAIVIADDSFASIVAAVAEGRGIHENIRRFIAFLIAGNAAAALALLAAAVAGVPPPLVPIQLLWINLVLAALPALALGLEPFDPGLMQEGPRSPRERILGGRTAALAGSRGGGPRRGGPRGLPARLARRRRGPDARPHARLRRSRGGAGGARLQLPAPDALGLLGRAALQSLAARGGGAFGPAARGGRPAAAARAGLRDRAPRARGVAAGRGAGAGAAAGHGNPQGRLRRSRAPGS